MEKWQNWNKRINHFDEYKDIKTNLIFSTKKEYQNVRFSIVIPTYKRYDYLGEALQSAIKQNTNSEFEVLIFDNDEKVNEQKLDLIKKISNGHPNVNYYLHEKNIGMFGNFNRAIEMANAKWVVVLHDDDMIKENYISEMEKHVKDDIGMIAPHPEILDERATNRNKKNGFLSNVMNIFSGVKPIKLEDFFRISGVSPICALINKEKFISMGGYDSKLFPSSDIGGVMKLLTEYPIYYLPRKLFFYRYSVNESLNSKTKHAFISDTYDITGKLGEYLSLNKNKIKKQIYQNITLAIKFSLFDNKEQIFDEYFSKYNIPKIYRKKIVQLYLTLKNQLFIFIRLFR